MPAYTVPGWPSAVMGHSAVMPHFNRLAASGAQAYKDNVTGRPGTVAIPTGRPPVPNDRTAQSMMGSARSSDAPDSFRPNQYWEGSGGNHPGGNWPGAGMPLRVISDNMMPVPARDPRGIPARLSSIPARRGNANLRQPANPITWPVWGRS